MFIIQWYFTTPAIALLLLETFCWNFMRHFVKCFDIEDCFVSPNEIFTSKTNVDFLWKSVKKFSFKRNLMVNNLESIIIFTSKDFAVDYYLMSCNNTTDACLSQFSFYWIYLIFLCIFLSWIDSLCILDEMEGRKIAKIARAYIRTTG